MTRFWGVENFVRHTLVNIIPPLIFKIFHFPFFPFLEIFAFQTVKRKYLHYFATTRIAGLSPFRIDKRFDREKVQLFRTRADSNLNFNDSRLESSRIDVLVTF